MNNLKELTNVTQKLLTNKKMKKLNLKNWELNSKKKYSEVKDIPDNEIKKPKFWDYNKPNLISYF